MEIHGMSDIERQILLNQFTIMGFLHGTLIDKISSLNEGTFSALRDCMRMTTQMLENDIAIKCSK